MQVLKVFTNHFVYFSNCSPVKSILLKALNKFLHIISKLYINLYSFLLCGGTQDGWVMVESSYKMWSTGEGNGKPLQYSCLENPMNGMKRQKDRTLKDVLPRTVCAQYATGDQWRNNSRKNEETEPKAQTTPSCGCD